VKSLEKIVKDTTEISLCSYIEHTLLKPEAPASHIKKLCQEAVTHQFAGICVHSYWIPFCKTLLDKESDQSEQSRQTLHKSVELVSVIGFPLGLNLTSSKVTEATQAVEQGATEIDMVLNIGAFKSSDFKSCLDDIQQVKKALGKIPLKVIIETGILNEAEKVQATQIVLDSGAEYIKTCTGFNPGQATVEDLSLMRKIIGSLPLKIKASGGIRNKEQALALIQAGASRLGTSQGPQLL
jgi:deoxyribose-phosphate aldolase